MRCWPRCSLSASRTAATRSFGASRPESPRICSGSIWVSTSTSSAEFGAQRGLEPVGDFVRLAERQAAVDFEIERHRQPPADRMHGDVMHCERAVARDHHDAFEHGLVVERARLGDDVDFGLGIRARIARPTALLDRGDAIERQRTAHRDHRVDEQRRADRAHAHAFDRHHAAVRAAISAIFAAAPSGAVSVSVSMVRRPSRQPAMQMNTATIDRGGGIRPRIAERDAAKPDQHRDRRPHVGAEMQRVGFERLARGLPGDAIEQRARARNRPRSTRRSRRRPRSSPRPRALAAEQALRGLPDHEAGQDEQQPGLDQRGDALDLAVAVMMLLVGRLAGDAHREPGHHGRGEVERRVRGFREQRERAGDKPTTALATVSPPDAAIEVSATRSLMSCMARLAGDERRSGRGSGRQLER